MSLHPMSTVPIMRHLEELALYRKCYSQGVVYEFDTLSDILAFDPKFR